MKLKKALGKIGTVLSYALVILEIVLILFVIVSKAGGQLPTVFGYQMFQVVTPSMEPEIMVGDIIISKAYNKEDLEVGDVITYIGREGDLSGKRITHKVIEVNGDKIVTQGVAAGTSPDPAITKDDVIGVMTYKTVVLDKVYKVISSTPGFILLLVLPLVIMIIYEFRDLVRQIRKEAGSVDEEAEDKSKTEEAGNGEKN